MKMDFQLPLIFISIVSLASLVLVFIFKFSVKEKSYEEALAEQRQQTNIFLGTKSKIKEKKNKKNNKKVGLGLNGKEKSTSVEETHPSVTEPEQTSVEKEIRPDFQDGTDCTSIKPPTNKKHNKKEKIRPIQINNDNVPNDILLINSIEDEPEKEKTISLQEEFETVSKIGEIQKSNVQTIKHKTITKKAELSVLKDVKQPAMSNGFSSILPIKEKKKKKNEYNTAQLVSNNGLNLTLLRDLIHNAEFSRSEVQSLIDLLLNKHHETPTVVNEWTEGKSDPLQKLKKQLSEKEKLLLFEQETVANTQSKLREIRVENSMLLQKIKLLDDNFQGSKIEIARCQHQIQQLQSQIKDEVGKNGKLIEEHSNLQIQRQQCEMRLGQIQESEILISQLQNQVQDVSACNNRLRVELNRLTDEKERNDSYLANFQKDLDQTIALNRQLKEACITFEHQIDATSKKERDYSSEVVRLNSLIDKQKEEIDKLENSKSQYLSDLQNIKEEMGKKISQLMNDLNRAQKETNLMRSSELNGEEKKQHEVEILNLHNQLSSLNAELQQSEIQYKVEIDGLKALNETLKGELKNSTNILNNEKLQIEEQKCKNNDLRMKNWKIMEALNAVESKLKDKTPTDVNVPEESIQMEFIKRLFPEISDRKELVDIESYRNVGEAFFKNYIKDLQNPVSGNVQEIDQYKQQCKRYKTTIDHTEKVLNSLQRHIEQEERSWRTQLLEKIAELESTQESNRQLQEQLGLLQKN